jgi:hypothetical protein
VALGLEKVENPCLNHSKNGIKANEEITIQYETQLLLYYK